MKVIIPAAGLGTRLRPHTYSKPKPLVNVAGKPVLGHILDKLAQVHPEEIIFITGYLGEQIEDYVRRNYCFPARFIEQTERRGQSHAIYLAREAIDQPVLIVFVDTIFEADLSQLESLAGDGAIYVSEVEDPTRFGVVQLKDGLVSRLVEKPKQYVSNLAVVGIYYLRNWEMLLQAIDDQMAQDEPTNGEYFLADALQRMIDRGARLQALPVSVWEDCGKREAVLQCNRYLLSVAPPQEVRLNHSIIVPPVSIAPTAEVINSIVGPYVTIGENARVENCVLQD
ncbi:MAG: sugar phosphate nucleotidyltransferase [Chloroflexi bacterium]|nr:sugar phosphate nucleotidyltransferase [Chloroflexota bacterium]